MKVKEIAQKVLERLGPNGENWTQGELARNVIGQSTTPDAPDAICWCISGAAITYAGSGSQDFMRFASAFASEANIRPGSVPVFNDTHTFPEVKAVLEELAK